ncbi:hypothetical protein F4780DRAFT_554585 [Xylariomycetidae sp. FL0641]|nr:hypothetical protein F4780DRAFT_554585 [Xylariomycetidae sp. FL0641]
MHATATCSQHEAATNRSATIGGTSPRQLLARACRGLGVFVALLLTATCGVVCCSEARLIVSLIEVRANISLSSWQESIHYLAHTRMPCNQQQPGPNFRDLPATSDVSLGHSSAYCLAAGSPCDAGKQARRHRHRVLLCTVVLTHLRMSTGPPHQPRADGTVMIRYVRASLPDRRLGAWPRARIIRSQSSSSENAGRT